MKCLSYIKRPNLKKKTIYRQNSTPSLKNFTFLAFYDSLWYSIVTAFSDAQKGFPWHPTLVDNVFWNIWLATILQFLKKSSKKRGGCKKELYLYDKTFKKLFLPWLRTAQCSKIRKKVPYIAFWGNCTLYDFHNSTDNLKFWTEKWAINKTFFLFFIWFWWNLVKL